MTHVGLCISVMPEGEKIGDASSKGWEESASLVGIGLSDLSNIGMPVAPRPPSSDITVYKAGVRRN